MAMMEYRGTAAGIHMGEHRKTATFEHPNLKTDRAISMGDTGLTTLHSLANTAHNFPRSTVQPLLWQTVQGEHHTKSPSRPNTIRTPCPTTISSVSQIQRL